MLSPDPASRNAVTGPASDVEQLLATLTAGTATPEAASLPPDFLRGVSEVLRTVRGRISVTIASPMDRSVHDLRLSRAGTLRRTRGPGGRDRLAIHPTSALPGLLLRLAAIAPTEPLPGTTVVPISADDLAALFAPDDVLDGAPWSRVAYAAAQLPAASRDGIDQAPPLAVRLARHQGAADSTVVLLRLRGRYLISEGSDPSGLHGATPTEAARAMLRAALTTNAAAPSPADAAI